MSAAMASLRSLGVLVALLIIMQLAPPAAINAQQNVQTRIPNWLQECYQSQALRNRETRLPSNINILIELIRKFENFPGMNMDMREVASTLVHRFRMDGIEQAPGQFLANVLPFSPSGFQFSKHRVLLARLVSGNGALFPNASLSAQERCALHFMLSTSIERQSRNDEQNVCNQLSQVRSMRIPRALRERRSVATRNNFVGDVELLEEHNQRKAKSGRYQLETDDADDEGTRELVAESTDGVAETTIDGEDGEVPVQPRVEDEVNTDLNDDGFDRNVETLGAGQTLSQCPVENGVLRTTWGAVSGGPLITGIAAGMQPQQVLTRDLLALSRAASQHQFARQSATNDRVDNRWAATLAGDLAEVTLLQGPITQSIQVGGIGGWNSSTIPRWYFLSQRDRLEMTDAEIRGGVDGLVLATNVQEYRNQAQGLRLSQLLDMYYSHRGVFSSNVRSCNRGGLFTQVAPMAAIRAQTEAFATVLDREMQMRVTLPQQSIEQFAGTAATALSTYIPQSLHDAGCDSTTIMPNDRTIWRAAADIYIYVDTTWTFREIQPVIATLLESLDVNPFNSNYTLLNARDANVLVRSTNSLSDFYLGWTPAVHQQAASGFVLPDILRSLRAITRELAIADARDSLNSRGAQLALIVPQHAAVSQADTEFALQEIGLLNDEAPDLTLLFLSGGVPTRFERFVRDPAADLYPLQVTGSNADNVVRQTQPLVQRIHMATRRITNPRCGPNWTQDGHGSNTQNQYVERGSVNYYRVLPNYFFHASGDDNRRVRIQGHNYGPITVCTSRSTAWPRQNASTADNDINCETLLSNSMEIQLRDNCDGHSIIHRCPPVYISVAAASAADSSPVFRCIDRECRFPDNIRFSIVTENLGCFNGVGRLSGGVLMALLTGVVVAMWSTGRGGM